MKNIHQNLLIVLALALCGLCAWQWYGETLTRRQMESANQLLDQKIALIQGYTNSIRARDVQIDQMGAQITQLNGTIKTNEQLILDQKRQLNKLEAENDALTNAVTQYKEGVEMLKGKLQTAYDDIRKQNDEFKVAIGKVVAQRDEFVQKYNNSVKDRNDVVTKYNELVAQYEKLQGAKSSK